MNQPTSSIVMYNNNTIRLFYYYYYYFIIIVIINLTIVLYSSSLYLTSLLPSSFFVDAIVTNDECINAQPITIGSTVVTDTRNATFNLNEYETCLEFNDYCYVPGIWYNFIGTGERLVVRSCFGDTISIYNGSCTSQLQCVAGSYNPCGRERFIFDTVQGTKYHVLVRLYPYGLGNLSIFVSPTINDICTNAQPFTIGSSIIVNATYATTDTNVNNCIVGENQYYRYENPGVWFNFTGTGERLVARSCSNNTYVKNYISVYKGDCATSQLQCVAAKKNPCEQYPFADEKDQAFAFDTVQGTKYHVLLQTYDELAELSIFASPVINDECITALPLTIGSNVIVDTTYATKDVTAWNDCVRGSPYPQFYRGMWFSFTGTGGELVARLCNIYSIYDLISVYKGNCAPSQLECVAGTISPCEQRELFIFDTVQDAQYYFLIQTYPSTVSDLSIFVSPIQNDNCINAQPFKIGSSVIANTTYATTDKTILNDCIYGAPPSLPGVWFNFNGTGERLVARSCNGGSSISVYKGECAPSQLQCVAGTTNPCGREPFIFDTVPGTNYHVLIQDYFDDLTDLSIFASPTVNDFCTNAQPITVGSSVTTNTTYATTDKNVLNDCIFGRPPTYPGVWFNFTGTGERLVTRSCNGGSSISVYKGECAPSQLQCVAGTTNPCGRERFIFDTVLGTNYHVLFQSYYDEIVDLAIFNKPIVSNDFCVNATKITFGVPINVDLKYALSDEGEVTDDCQGITSLLDPGVWFTFNGTGGSVEVDPCRNLTFSFSRVFASVYDGGCDKSLLSCLAVGRIDCGRNKLIFPTERGKVYFVLIQAPSVTEDTFPLLFLPVKVPTIAPSKAPTKRPTRRPTKSPSKVPTKRPTKRPTKAPITPPINILPNNPSTTMSPTTLPSLSPSSAPTHLPSSTPTYNPSISTAPTGLPSSTPTNSPSISTAPSQSSTVNPTRQPSSAPIRRSRPIVVSIVRGDPHITTLDGLEYDCQARGEFILLKSLNTTFQIQTRFTKASTSGTGSSASVNAGLVISELDAPMIQVSYKTQNAKSIAECFALITLYENGITRPLLSGALSSKVSISVLNGEEIVIIFRATGLEIHLFVKSSSSFGCFFTQYMILPENYRADETLFGLLGNANGNPYDDWQTNLGVTLPTPSNASAIFQGGYDYCRTQWCIRQSSDSLFTYSSGESFSAYYDCDAPYDSNVEKSFAAASIEIRNICGSDVQCIIDGVIGTTLDAQSLLNDTDRIKKVILERNITYNFNETISTTVPTKSPTLAPISSPSTCPPCGIFGGSIFCPFTFCGFFGRFIRRLF